mgnify:CR=1 FL=1
MAVSDTQMLANIALERAVIRHAFPGNDVSAALAETVEGAVAIKRPQLKGLINGVLRQFQRQQDELLAEFNASDA